jgi:hypothetical protein
VRITLRCCGCWPTVTTTSPRYVLKRCAGVHATLRALTPGGLARRLSAARAARAATHNPSQRSGPDRTQRGWPNSCSATSADSTPSSPESKTRIQAAVAASGTTVTQVYGVRGDCGWVADRAQQRHSSVRVQESLRHLQRDRADPGLQRAADTSPAQPGRQPPTQPRVAHTPRSHRYATTPPDGLTTNANSGEGKSSKKALRALKQRVSDAVYRQLIIDANSR